jgi:hypothetical protein
MITSSGNSLLGDARDDARRVTHLVATSSCYTHKSHNATTSQQLQQLLLQSGTALL